MPSRDLSAFLDDDSLKYEHIPSKKHPLTKTGGGKTYVVESPDAKTGLYLASIGEMGLAQGGKAPVLDDAEERSLMQMVLGKTLDEMKTDGVPWAAVQQVFADAFLYWSVNPEFADAVLESRGKVQAVPNRAEKRATARKAPAKKAAAKTTGRTPARRAG